jgi:hypothetical protein
LVEDAAVQQTAASLADLARALTHEAAGQFETPPNLIPPRCKAITPAMLPLVEMEPQHIEQIVQTVPGGAGNIQDIYPFALLWKQLPQPVQVVYRRAVLPVEELALDQNQDLSVQKAALEHHGCHIVIRAIRRLGDGSDEGMM